LQELETPFTLKDIQRSSKDYGKAQAFAYVNAIDADEIIERALLKPFI